MIPTLTLTLTLALAIYHLVPSRCPPPAQHVTPILSPFRQCGKNSYSVPDPDVVDAERLNMNVTMCTATLMEPGPNADFSKCEALEDNEYEQGEFGWLGGGGGCRFWVVGLGCRL